MPRRAVILAVALVPSGTIAGHVVGYGIAGQHASLNGSHSYLGLAAWLAALALLAALGWAAGTRSLSPSKLPVAWLAGAQATLFLGLESAEQLAGGHGLRHILAEPALRWGLLAQAAAAAVLVVIARSVRVSGERIRALLASRSRNVPVPPVPMAPAFVAAVVRSLTLASCVSERGPPQVPLST